MLQSGRHLLAHRQGEVSDLSAQLVESEADESLSPSRHCLLQGFFFLRRIIKVILLF